MKIKNWKTTLIGCLMAALMAAKPILDGSGYHFDAKTISEIVFAVLMAVGGVMVKDFDNTGNKTLVLLPFFLLATLGSCSLSREINKHCRANTYSINNGEGFKACVECDTSAHYFLQVIKKKKESQ